MAEDSLAQLMCLKEACKQLDLLFSEKDSNGNLIQVRIGDKDLFFVNFATPFNSGAVEQICKDKEFTYLLLHKSVQMPKTQGYFDPDYREEYGRFKTFQNVEAIAGDIESRFSYPVVIKRNAGTRGINVFLCKSREEIREALLRIFKKDSEDYDYVALAQEYITPTKEYRTVLFRGKAVLLYATNSLWSSQDRGIQQKEKFSEPDIEEFLSPVANSLPVIFTGADIIRDSKGKFWLLELNSRPGFTQFIRDHGKEPVIDMYERILKSYA